VDFANPVNEEMNQSTLVYSHQTPPTGRNAYQFCCIHITRCISNKDARRIIPDHSSEAAASVHKRRTFSTLRINGGNEVCLNPGKTLQFHPAALGDTNSAKNPTEVYSQRHPHERPSNFSPATWQLIVTFALWIVFTVLPISTVTAGDSVLITVALDAFISGFPV